MNIKKFIKRMQVSGIYKRCTSFKISVFLNTLAYRLYVRVIPLHKKGAVKNESI